MINIREANSSDFASLQSLIKEWMSTRKLFPTPSDPPNIDVFENCVSGTNKLYFCVVAEDEVKKTLIGYALTTFNYAVWLGKSMMLENIFVQRDYRRKGIGRRLLSAVIEDGLKRGCRNVNFYTEEDDESAGFFDKVGRENKTLSEGWLVYTLPYQSIHRVATAHCS